MNLDWNERATTPMSRMFQHYERMYTDHRRGFIEEFHPFALVAKANQEDYPTYREVLRMNDEDKEEWMESMKDKMEGLYKKGTYELIDLVKAEKTGRKIIPTMWALRIKRLIDGTPTRKKSRVVLRGDLQKDLPEMTRNATFAPVVDWSTLRLLLSLTLHEGWKTKQVDCIQAFLHAPLVEETYAELPPGGWKEANPGKVMKLKKSLYGNKRAPQMWFNHLKTGLEARGWKQSDFDPCLFLRNDVLFTVYCDDCIFFSKNEESIQAAFDSLITEIPGHPDGHAFEMKIEGELCDYLGVAMDRDNVGTLEMSQYHLTKRIIAATGLEDANPQPTPVSQPLGKELDSGPCQESWSMRSIVGMLQYLANNTRCEIAYAVNNVARHCNAPMRNHELAIKRIVKYLKGSLYTDSNGNERVRGTFLNRDALHHIKQSKLSLDMYCDADFGGLYGFEDSNDPICAHSRTGYVIMLGGMPVMWQSKLQPVIASSTAEAESQALATGMRSLVHLRRVLFEIDDVFQIGIDRLSKISNVYEDNQACLLTATADPPRLTPRNKSWAIKIHWYRQWLKDGEIMILPIPTGDQTADILTKPLSRELFERHRKVLLGW